MKILEIICFLIGISLVAVIFIRVPLKMARIETNTNKGLDNTIIVLTSLYICTVLGLKCW